MAPMVSLVGLFCLGRPLLVRGCLWSLWARLESLGVPGGLGCLEKFDQHAAAGLNFTTVERSGTQ